MSRTQIVKYCRMGHSFGFVLPARIRDQVPWQPGDHLGMQLQGEILLVYRADLRPPIPPGGIQAPSKVEKVGTGARDA